MTYQNPYQNPYSVENRAIDTIVRSSLYQKWDWSLLANRPMTDTEIELFDKAMKKAEAKAQRIKRRHEAIGEFVSICGALAGLVGFILFMAYASEQAKKAEAAQQQTEIIIPQELR